MTAREYALQLPPDVLEHPMPLPQRLNYAEAIIKRAQEEAVRAFIGESRATNISEQSRVATTTAFDIITDAQTVTALYRDEMERIVRQEVETMMRRLPRRISAGKFTLQKINGKFWLDNADGEAMETSEAKIEQLLKQFFTKEF